MKSILHSMKCESLEMNIGSWWQSIFFFHWNDARNAIMQKHTDVKWRNERETTTNFNFFFIFFSSLSKMNWKVTFFFAKSNILCVKRVLQLQLCMFIQKENRRKFPQVFLEFFFIISFLVKCCKKEFHVSLLRTQQEH